MERGKIVAIVTGAISIIIAIAYLVIVQLIDFRGEMIPAPVSQLIGAESVLIGFGNYNQLSVAPTHS